MSLHVANGDSKQSVKCGHILEIHRRHVTHEVEMSLDQPPGFYPRRVRMVCCILA
jgi:hypothetical protein